MGGGRLWMGLWVRRQQRQEVAWGPFPFQEVGILSRGVGLGDPKPFLKPHLSSGSPL